MRMILSLSYLILLNSAVRADWVQIAAGPSFEYAQAYCDNASMGVGRSVFLYGDSTFVGGGLLGNAIRNRIEQARFRKNCMIMNGWKEVKPVTRSRAKGNWNQDRNK